ncbi:hypothetical protein J437_LFUL001198 [Ladona fulva]|uniref:Aromatic amino acid beta-eliminating lyase/threonine aldolase domain-containing protein n=1 Tax=Ladona fulva TaxID=123851 RepID=A0A8K0JVA5_LADFU|nr:hypothetical protein J437_LFUL001198 [Ladona fulva]
MVKVIDLRSDTISRPTKLMKQAMLEAIVGDDVYREDPTINELERKAASMLGKEAALYVPTGTMGNLIGMMVHCPKRGSEILMGDLSHTFLYEQGGAAQLGGIHLHILPNRPDGTFDINLMKSKVRTGDIFEPITSLIVVENTHNMCGGKALPMKWLDELAEAASSLNIPLHMDGARLFNAAVYLGIPAKEIIKNISTVSVCFSKGLGAPIGSVLVGPKILMEEARRLRKVLGGGMRQAGFMAATGIVALDTMIDRLAIDHQHTYRIAKARRLRKVLGGGMRQAGFMAATGIVALDTMIDRLAIDHQHTYRIAKAIENTGSKYFSVDLKNLHTNILQIWFDSEKVDPVKFCERLAKVEKNEKSILGKEIAVKMTPMTKEFMRLVLYHEITEEDVQDAIKKLVKVVDLRSDTISRPTAVMRQAMFEAVVGDDVYGEDPTVIELEKKAASMLGKEEGLFVPSGTMGNLIAMMIHSTRRGSEVFVGDRSHTFLYEQGGAAQLGGIQLHILPNNPDGTFDIDLMKSKVRTRDVHEPTTSLIVVENTHNICGGKVLPIKWLDELAEAASSLNIPLHMDGARLFNAAVYLGIPAKEIVKNFSSVTFCLSKSLGAPVGSVLVGSKKFIYESRRLRKALGGGMRQADHKFIS